MQQAINDLWRFTGELFHSDDVERRLAEQGIAVNPESLQAPWLQIVQQVLQEATLQLPEGEAYRHGGKQGKHTEHLGFMLAEMQFLQRAYPGCRW